MNDFTELEYKYKASGVSLTEFQELMEELGYDRKIDVSSWDIYYTVPNNPDWFQRFRNGEKPELTKKRKVKSSNNWERVEVDLPLDPSVKEETVTKYVGLDNYTENFRVYKSCFIYWLENVNFVYYNVYDKEMHEQGRFIEVEVNKNKVSGLGEGAMDVLKEYEQKLSKLSINPQNRLKKSLFEMFVT